MRWFTLLLIVLFVACGGSSTPSDDEASSGGTSEEDGWDDDDWGDDPEPSVESHHGAIEQIGISGPDSPWAEMSHEDREWYMVGKVLPIMKEVFAEQDEARWNPANYGCATCHGADGEESGYSMPHASQFRVPEPGTQAWQNMERIFPAVVTFMTETVTPTMGTLLGVEDYTCNHCHPGAG